eukprot:CAMPEP_0175556330 /NCGR_PEP_ID=MMETSP0096-20121207/34812_1 /TAXON_ID=311494 /ORGANISM="Alexandrium monilatum, Strain CCMP3105" /LENGTH=115 /DNA_ID=CAMNT_0016859461 /DNA_START=83 /DNA_END=425 /DNA_ORIENTATION=-
MLIGGLPGAAPRWCSTAESLGGRRQVRRLRASPARRAYCAFGLDAEGLVVLRPADALHEVARLCHTPRCDGPGRGVVVVEAARLEVGLQVLRGLDGVVAGKCGEEVVADVRGADV